MLGFPITKTSAWEEGEDRLLTMKSSKKTARWVDFVSFALPFLKKMSTLKQP